MSIDTNLALYESWLAREMELYDEAVPTVYAGLLHDIGFVQGAPNFAWHMAEVGLTPDTLRDFAERWRNEEFVPAEIADTLERFAQDLQAVGGYAGSAFGR